RPGWVRAIGQRLLAPGAAPSCHSDPLSGSACGSGCGGCASGESPAPAVEHPIRIVRRK
ncbi:membrane protein, partial [Ralstonia solanacearum]